MKNTHYSLHSRAGGAALAIAVAASLGACNSGSDTASRADSAASDMANRAGTAIDTAASAGAMAADTLSNRVGSALSTGDWTDADIVAYLVAADSGEIAAGKLASTKATNPAVKSFAKKMVNDHQEMLDGTTELASSASISASSATNDDVQGVRDGSQDALDDLTNKTAGAEWDNDYVGKQVDAHQDVIDHVTDFAQAAQNPQLRSMLQQALPHLQAHLEAAKGLQQAEISN